MGRPEYVSGEKERDGDAVTARGESREEDEERRPQEEGAEGGGTAEEEGAEEEGAEGGGTVQEGGSGDEESNDELGHERTAAIEVKVVKGEMAGQDNHDDDDSDSDDAPKEFTLSQVRAHRHSLAAKGEEGEGGEEGDSEERRNKEVGGEAKRRRELEGRAERRTRQKGAAEGADEAAGSLVTAEARDGAREGSDGEEARAGDGEGEGGALGKGAVEGGDFLLADVIAAVTLRQHPRSDGAIVIQAGAPAPEGEEEARAIMRATLSFRLRVMFRRRQRSVAALGFVDPKALKVAGQWCAHKHLVAEGAGT
ncbi:unnamed protein product [Closterium sp. NIES-65]|nr:unnamed protein product [Closterium sp. NIES-65]